MAIEWLHDPRDDGALTIAVRAVAEQLDRLNTNLEQQAADKCSVCTKPQSSHFFPMGSNTGHCAKCEKPMQFADGICFACNGGRDPGD